MADSYALTRTHSYRAGEKKRRACNINQVIFIILWYSVSGSGSAHGVGIHARPFAHRHFRNIHVFGLMRLDSFCFVLLASSSARRHLFRGPFLFVKAKKEKCETRETQSWKKKMWTRIVLVAKKKMIYNPIWLFASFFFHFFLSFFIFQFRPRPTIFHVHTSYVTMIFSLRCCPGSMREIRVDTTMCVRDVRVWIRFYLH